MSTENTARNLSTVPRKELLAERDRLREQNKALREALEGVVGGCISGNHQGSKFSENCRACQKACALLSTEEES